jgi:hypothetical protein
MKKIKLLIITCLFFCFNHFKAQTYWVLQKKLDGGYYQMPSGGILNFKFLEEYPKQASSNLNYKIYKDNETLEVGCGPSLTEKLGDNRFQLNLGSCSLTTNNFYIIEVFNEKKERWVGRFKYN